MSTSPEHIDILDCTLRDGSYQIDFGITRDQTRSIAAALQTAGVQWIEAGPGLGLGATRSGKAVSAESDRDYMEAVRQGAANSRVGVFAIPGIATLDDLDCAADMGMDFIRIGMDAVRFEDAGPFIEHARGLNLHATAFLMKSYTLPPEEMRKRAHCFTDWGTDAVAIVDSAGGMVPAQVAEYVGIVHDLGGPAVAFHGHNNLQLAVGNALVAVSAGASVLDATLRGLGRSAGNAQIEALTIALSHAGYHVDPDPRLLISAAERFVKPLDCDYGMGETELIQGRAFVHSGMQPVLEQAAGEFDIDLGDLIEAAGRKRGGLDLSKEEVLALAAGLAGNK